MKINTKAIMSVIGDTETICCNVLISTVYFAQFWWDASSECRSVIGLLRNYAFDAFSFVGFQSFSISSFSLRCSTHCWQKHCYKYSIIRNIFTIIANPVINFFSKRILFLLQSIRFSSPFAHFSWDLCSFRAHKSYQKLRAAERGLQSLEKWNLMFKLINQWNETIRVDNSTDKNKNGRNKFTWM